MQDGYDQQLRFAEILPDFQHWLDWMARESATFTDWTPKPYGGHERQHVEIRGAATPGRILPVFFHGGYWRALDAPSHRFVAGGLETVGPMQVNAEYRLMPDARMAELIDDASQALRAAARAAPDCPVLAIGHSAGAHLALWAVERCGLPAERIAGLVAISGIYDLAPIARSFLQDELTLTDTEIARFSPLGAELRGDVRRHLVVGELETALYHEQAEQFSRTSSAGRSVVRQTHHMSVIAQMADPESDLTGALNAFANHRAVAHSLGQADGKIS